MTKPAWGVCGPINPGRAAFDVMKASGFTQYRFNMPYTDDSAAKSEAMLAIMLPQAKAAGVTLKPIVQLPFAFADAEDGRRHRVRSFAPTEGLYTSGFMRLRNLLAGFPSIMDWEIGNELNRAVLDKTGNPIPTYGVGFEACEYDRGPWTAWAAVLRGACDAIERVRGVKGLPYRCIIGTTSTHFGMLKFMRAQDVRFRAISYHYYEEIDTNPHAYWGSFDLFKMLDSFGVPVTVNELNAGEVYTSTDEALIERSLTKTIGHFRDGTFKNLESVLFYCLFDKPELAGPEGRFGLMRDINTPKPLLAAVQNAIR